MGVGKIFIEDFQKNIEEQMEAEGYLCFAIIQCIDHSSF